MLLPSSSSSSFLLLPLQALLVDRHRQPAKAVAVSQVLYSKAGGQGLLQLVRLIAVKHTQRIEVLLAPHLELHHILAALYLHGTRVLPARC
jgi:hypothetical protein